ncbi:rRNA maturation RNase YbeY [candidate division WWE3 bacterium RIFCSPHIGHO2_01_FULL_48_15]|uniref:rRNA maturation RNase YbeY n=1 Tax=candidate division WWE3 bacterium RIFCSPHIGHO2_01_FULL_48_15 TaxID=1802619 RepID=A0A1F4VAL7_UNCKA|nr:MAG: rRNA maturation RNase YbeY [candidate division WWE3 bacterium RIFCSPHIGHO2_01_FULL_48_15]
MEIKVTVSFLPPKKIQKLNKDLRGKSYIPAVLSFPYFEPTEEGMLLGEVLICKPEARKLAKKNKVTEEEQINQLIVHGIKHILGVHED